MNANAEVLAEYQGQHTPSESGAPLHDLTGGGEIYPDDIYSPQGLRFYAGESETAGDDWRVAVSYRGRPDALVVIYRAVPVGVESINAGDWVAISRQYAEEHGEARAEAWGGSFQILTLEVRAEDIRTMGDSVSEWGYFPAE